MSRSLNKAEKEVPKGFCRCGCGEKTNPAKETNSSRGWVQGEPVDFVQGHHVRHPDFAHMRPVHGADNPAWKGGRLKGQDGYIRVYDPSPFRASVYREEHVVIAERALGKPMPSGAHVHHINGDRADNRPENLVICEDAAYHKTLHIRADALRACGHADWRKCSLCGDYAPPDDPDLYISPEGSYARHRSCFASYARSRRSPGPGRAKGERCGAAVLTRRDVMQVKRRIRRGDTNTSIATTFGVDPSTISLIRHGKTWTHINENMEA